MTVKSPTRTGTNVVAPARVTVQVQVVASWTTGSPSPGTIGPVTLACTEAPVSLTRTLSPCEVTAGLAAVPVSSLFATTVGVGRKLGSVPYEGSTELREAAEPLLPPQPASTAMAARHERRRHRRRARGPTPVTTRTVNSSSC